MAAEAFQSVFGVHSTVISPPKHSDASWAESKDLTSASLNRYLQREACVSSRHSAGSWVLNSLEDLPPHSPLVVLVGVRVDDVSDEAVVVAAVRRARVHRHADQVVLVALGHFGLAVLPETCSSGQSFGLALHQVRVSGPCPPRRDRPSLRSPLPMRKSSV